MATGDVNGDGVADVIIGAQDHNAVYVVFGGPTRKDGSAWSTCPCTLNSPFLNGTNGAEFDGANGEELGNAVAAGDINGDGISDLIMGAYGASPGSNSSAGAVYVVFGKTGAWSSTATTLTSGSNPLDGTHGTEFDGAAHNYYVGHAIATGDVNGDGIADLIIGAYGAHSSNGAVYVVFGKTGGCAPATTLNSGNNPLDGTHGAELVGGVATGQFGYSIATGDVNGDGIPDLVIGTQNAAAVYVVFGKTGAWKSATTLTSGSNPLDGTHRAEFDGANSINTNFGFSVATGDVNGDGIADLLIGMPTPPGGGLGTDAVYAIFGKTGAWSAATILTADSGTNPLDGTHGARIRR